MKSANPKALVFIGGTFDPVHYGHLRTALEVRNALQLDEICFLPAGEPPHRGATVSDASHRLAMLRLATKGLQGFRIDEQELMRGGPSFMVDTLECLRKESVEASLVLVVGQDSANTFETWHRWREIFALANLVIMSRLGDKDNYPPDLEGELSARRVDRGCQLMSSPAGKVMKIGVTDLSISSSGIREMLQAGVSPRFLLPDAVLAYIQEQGLYL